MLTVEDYSVEFIKDPFGILSGKRYEFRINLEIPEDDDLYTVNGVYARVIVKEENGEANLVTYDLVERGSDKILEFDLEDDEEVELAEFCKTHMPEDE